MATRNSSKNAQKTIEIDASGKILGRLATEVAIILRGKDKPTYKPYLDEGPNVMVYNLAKIKVTGNKREQKIYWHHTGYPGGIKSITYKKLFEKDPTQVFKKAVFGMLPKNKLRAKMMRRLKLYSGEIK